MTSDECLVPGRRRSPQRSQTPRVLLLALAVVVARAAGQSAIDASAKADVEEPLVETVAPVKFHLTKNPPPFSQAKKWWVVSGVVLTAASLFDFGASIGHKEANPSLRSSTGEFSIARGISFKLSLAGATLLLQSLMARHRPNLYGPSAIANAAGAAAFGAAAIHDLNTPR